MPPTNSILVMLSKETINWQHIYVWGFKKELNVRGTTNHVPSQYLLSLDTDTRHELAQKAFEQGYLLRQNKYATYVFQAITQNPNFTDIPQRQSKNIYLLAAHKNWKKLIESIARRQGKKGNWVFLPEKVNLAIKECSSDLNITDLAYLDSYGNTNEQPHAKQFFDLCIQHGIKGNIYHGDMLAVYIRNQQFDVIFNKFYHHAEQKLHIPADLDVNAELPIPCEQNTQGFNLIDFCFYYGYEAIQPNQWALTLFEMFDKQENLSPNIFQRPCKRLHAIATQLNDDCYQAVNRICLLDLGDELSLNPNIDFDVLIQIESGEYTIRKLIEEHAANTKIEAKKLQPLKDILAALPPPPKAPKPVAITPSFDRTKSSSPLLAKSNDIDSEIATALDRKL